MGLAFAAVLCLVTGVTTALADGGSTEIFRTKQGPYEIIVGIIPATPVVGVIHFSVTVVGANSGDPVSDAMVTIAAQGPQDLAAGPVTIVNTATSYYYDANITVAAIGDWQFQVTVDSPLGKERVTFPLRVQTVTVNWGAIASVLVAILLVVPLVVLGYQSLRRRRQKR